MSKKISTIGIVFSVLALVGLVLVIVGMCTGVVSAGGESTTLFDEGWEMFESDMVKAAAKAQGLTLPSRTFPIIAFVVAIIGAVAALAYCVLGMVGKEVKILGLVAGGVAILGGILVLVAGLVLAGQFNDCTKIFGMDSVSAGVGVWLGMIGGLLAGVPAILGALKVGQKG
ncbi:MAG: hypothetical protein J1F69_03370 [Clostridiales bacterium]|nr:hypothetical protein [Clostridiales bacterium]